MPEDAHLEPIKPSCISVCGPQYLQSRKSGPTDLDLLPSQRLRMQDMDARLQPTENPYHWEVPAQGRNSNISSWVKASWTRTNEIIRQQAGTLNRKIAVRRTHKGRMSLNTDGAHYRASHHGRVLPNPMTHRSISFGDEGQRKDLSTALEEAHEEGELSTTIRRVDSGIEPLSGGRSTRFREELEERPRIARAFSEILGSEPFVPTALLEAE